MYWNSWNTNIFLLHANEPAFFWRPLNTDLNIGPDVTFLVQLFAAVDGGGSDFWHIVVTGHQKYLEIPQAVGGTSQDQLPQCVDTTHHSILQSVNQKD